MIILNRNDISQSEKLTKVKQQALLSRQGSQLYVLTGKMPAPALLTPEESSTPEAMLAYMQSLWCATLFCCTCDPQSRGEMVRFWGWYPGKVNLNGLIVPEARVALYITVTGKFETGLQAYYETVGRLHRRRLQLSDPERSEIMAGDDGIIHRLDLHGSDVRLNIEFETDEFTMQQLITAFKQRLLDLDGCWNLQRAEDFEDRPQEAPED